MSDSEKMHCPRCGQVYPDVYQRFCDIDGARLVRSGSEKKSDVGVFTAILGKGERDAAQSDISLPAELALEDRRVQDRRKDLRLRELFDQIDLDDTELESDTFVIEELPRPKPAARRVAPSEIPSGTVDLDERAAMPASLNQFRRGRPEDFVGSRVKGRYRVNEMLSIDDTAVAYLAEDEIGSRRVVVRVLTADRRGQDDDAEGIILEERVSLSHINHPNVARLFDSGSWSDGTHYLISEYLEGLTLEEVMQIHGKLAPERAARLVKQAAYAVSEVHNERLLHRDIRPANIVVVSDGGAEIVKVTNFGAADGLPNALNAAYQSPETLDGDEPTAASDIFSLGVVAYEMINGRRPFDGETDIEIARAQRSMEYGADGIDSVFAKALALNPQERYVTAREFGDAFAASASVLSAPGEPALGSEPEQMFRPDGTPLSPDDPQWARRSPEPPSEPNEGRIKAYAIGVALLLAAIIIAAVMLSRRVPETPAPNTAGNIPADGSNRSVVPPLERRIPQPENTVYFQSSKQNVRGDLIRNFVGFKLYYPKEWTDNRARAATTLKGRGKFLDISKTNSDGGLIEQMLVSYYPSKGTFADDEMRFPELVQETSDTLKELIPNYQIVSQGPTKVNGEWDAYEIKFQGSGVNASGQRLLVWGRRLFIPAARPGVRNGFEVTMLATSNSDQVRSVDDVGTKGDLAGILYSFEPGQNF